MGLRMQSFIGTYVAFEVRSWITVESSFGCREARRQLIAMIKHSYWTSIAVRKLPLAVEELSMLGQRNS